MGKSERNIGLDVLRAAAILGVFLCHGVDMRIRGVDLFESLGSGVELFFVLSGFLIGRIYFRSAGPGFSFWSFWRSRWWRTLPPYLATILLYLVMWRVYPGLGPIHWYYGLFAQNYVGINGFGPSWSLCVEEHFYLLLPIAGFAISRLLGFKSFYYALPVAFLVPLGLRLALIPSAHLPKQWFWFTHLHCDGLIAGVWLAFLYVHDRGLWTRIKKPALWLLPVSPVVVLILPWATHTRLLDMVVNTFYALGYAAWVRCLYDLRWPARTMPSRLGRWLATGIALCSYSVYLTHTIFDPWIRNGVLGSMHRGVGKTVLVLASTFLLGIIFYFLIERPTIISRDRLLKQRRKESIGSGGKAVVIAAQPISDAEVDGTA